MSDFLPRSGVEVYAVAEISGLRAHAAQKSNSQCGLRFQRVAASAKFLAPGQLADFSIDQACCVKGVHDPVRAFDETKLAGRILKLKFIVSVTYT